jgi:hypothetical protein
MLAENYRNNGLDAQIAEARRQLEALPWPSAIRRAQLSPATRHELESIETAIASASDLATLDALGARLEPLLERIDDEVQRAHARTEPLPVPPVPGRYLFGRRKTFSLEFWRPDLLPGSKEHGVARLAEGEHDGMRFWLVAHGFRFTRFLLPEAQVECLLRTAAPRGPAFTVERRGFFAADDAIPIAPELDQRLVVRGQADVARAVLDPALQRRLLRMGNSFRMVFVGEGFVDLAWTQPLPAKGEQFPRESELGLVTLIAKRLWEA